MTENRYELDGFLITEYLRNGEIVAIIKTVINNEIIEQEPTDPQPTIEDIAEENLLETKYQTLLLEMML